MFLLAILTSCGAESSSNINSENTKTDSLEIVGLISERENAMIVKDIETAMSQFSEDATWINSQGYYFEGKNEVLKFHNMLAVNDSLDYEYEAGESRIRMLDDQNAIAYYSWKMFWFRKEAPSDTTMREIGLMTLTPQKFDDQWKWVAVTNQHTPWFYETIEPVVVE